MAMGNSHPNMVDPDGGLAGWEGLAGAASGGFSAMKLVQALGCLASIQISGDAQSFSRGVGNIRPSMDLAIHESDLKSAETFTPPPEITPSLLPPGPIYKFNPKNDPAKSSSILTSAGAVSFALKLFPQTKFVSFLSDVSNLISSISIFDKLFDSFSKGGKQGLWDDELSPLSNEGLKSAKEAAHAAKDKIKIGKINKEEKRRGTRNKQKRKN